MQGSSERHDEVGSRLSQVSAIVSIVVMCVAFVLVLGMGATAQAMTLVEPYHGAHVDHLTLAPTVSFDPAADETPKWVLLASDVEMKHTVRYCREFVWAYASETMHWGCNRWSIGADSQGADVLKELDENTTYYWQVISSKAGADGAAATDVGSEVRTFTIDAEPAPEPEPETESLAAISGKIMGTVFDDGTYLNLGASAFVNSKVRGKAVSTQRLGLYAFRINVTFTGKIDASRSYVRISSAAGTRYIPLRRVKGRTILVRGVWSMNDAERRLGTKRFTYQAFLKSATNGSMVRSQARVLFIKAGKPAWKPARTTVRPG